MNKEHKNEDLKRIIIFRSKYNSHIIACIRAKEIIASLQKSPSRHSRVYRLKLTALADFDSSPVRFVRRVSISSAHFEREIHFASIFLIAKLKRLCIFQSFIRSLHLTNQSSALQMAPTNVELRFHCNNGLCNFTIFSFLRR